MGLVGRAFDAWGDWALGSRTSFGAITKVFGSVGVLLAVILAPFLMLARANLSNLEHRMNDLDQQATLVFQDVADCTDMGYGFPECDASQKAAYDIANNLGTTLSYDSYSECFQVHGTANKVTTPITTTTYVNRVPITTTTYVTNYHPLIVAWQAAQGDLDIAVPLYSFSADGQAIRWDGTVFNLGDGGVVVPPAVAAPAPN